MNIIFIYNALWLLRDCREKVLDSGREKSVEKSKSKIRKEKEGEE